VASAPPATRDAETAAPAPAPAAPAARLATEEPGDETDGYDSECVRLQSAPRPRAPPTPAVKREEEEDDDMVIGETATAR